MKEPIFKLKKQKSSGNYGKFTIEPLENGFGHTVGNALRRILLSNLKGGSLSKIKIEGIDHKFSTLEGMKEDIVDLILQLKKVKVAFDKEEPVTAKLDIKGPKKVTASDIKFPPSVKLINSDHEIASLTKGSKLSAEIQISSGYGYSPAEERELEKRGEIPLDALYSPVEKVSYTVEKTRVGRQTDYDKLIIEIHTDGSQEPEKVLKDAAKLAVKYFQQVYEPKEIEVEEKAEEVEDLPDSYALTVEELGLPTRIANALKNGGYKTIEDLVNASIKELKTVKNIGAKSIDVVKEALAKKDVELEK